MQFAGQAFALGEARPLAAGLQQARVAHGDGGRMGKHEERACLGRTQAQVWITNHAQRAERERAEPQRRRHALRGRMGAHKAAIGAIHRVRGLRRAQYAAGQSSGKRLLERRCVGQRADLLVTICI